MTAETTYLGFEIVVERDRLIVLGRDGKPIETEKKIESMATARKLISELRRAEREAA